MWDLVGHEEAVERLRRSLSAGHVSHAYLLAGPARVGKATLALRLAQALNCSGSEPPCGECKACRRIASGSYLDVRVVSLGASAGEPEDGDERRRPRSGEKAIGIDQIRALQREVALSPHEGRYKVYIILNAEHLSVEASNSLLKVLEEPPPRVVLLLTTTDANMLLPTIVSRCQLIKLQPVSAGAIARHLHGRLGIDEGRASLLARLSGGRVGWAIAAAADGALLAERAEALARLVSLVGAGPAQRLAAAGKLAAEHGRNRDGVCFALELWTTWWRDVFLVQAGVEDLVANCDQLETLRGHAAGCTAFQVRAYLARIEAALAQLEQNVNPRLALEALLLNIPRVHIQSIGDEGLAPLVDVPG